MPADNSPALGSAAEAGRRLSGGVDIEELARLKGTIKARFGSIYAFAKFQTAGMARGTLYQVLNGRYGGNIERQAAKIRAYLEAPPETALTKAGTVETLKRVACGRCRRKRPRARQCGQCSDLWRAQAEALEGEGNDQAKQD